MKLYYSKGACSLAVRIIINELNIPCEYEAVNLKTKITETGADFLTINPKGSVPTLLLDDKQVLTENGVIQQYLADHYAGEKLLPLVPNMRRYRVLEWLNFVTTELHKGCSPLFNPEIPQEIKDKIFIPNLKRKFDFVENNLKDNTFLLGQEFCLADGYLFVILNWLPSFKIDISVWPRMSIYFAALKNRESIHKSLQQEGL
ncbi:MAG: glutathione transferase GstA [Gammaproteobacteria bacterium]|nr:glutathione transferase GstA [Gammaproteobacteria bacterium]